MHPRSIIAAVALLALACCNSPLDVPTKRIDTQLTNRIKVREAVVNAMIERPADTVTIDGWPHTAVSAIFDANTNDNPPHFRMSYRMQAIAADTRPSVWVKEAVIELDDVKAGSAVTLPTGTETGSRVAATVIVDGREYTTTTDDNASGTFYYLKGEKESIQGTILIGIDRTPGFSVLLAINFTASQD